VPAAGWGIATWYLPNRAERWEDVVPGAVVFGVGVLLLHVVTVYWIVREVEHKTDTYGAIGAALAILLWAYLLGRLMAASAVLNVTLVDRRDEKRDTASEPDA